MNPTISIYAIPCILLQRRDCLKKLTEPKNITSDRIISEVCEHFNLFWDEINLLKRANRQVVQARQIIIYLHTVYTELTLKQIGQLFKKNFDHTTVLYSRQKIKDLMQTDPEINDHVKQIRMKLS